MPELKTEFIPLLPLNNAVVLPGMVVTIPVEREEAGAAIAAAREGDGLVLLVPRVEGKYASIGTVAKIEDSRKLPNGVEVAIRSEERRVGKECRSRRSPYHKEKKKRKEQIVLV